MAVGAVSPDADGEHVSFMEMVCSPIWYGAAAVFCNVVCNVMLMGYISTVVGEQLGDSALLCNNIAYVICSVFSLYVCPAYGYISQPHRCGRKWILILISLLNIVYVAGVVFSNSAVWILVSKVLVGMLGGGFPSPSHLATVKAWATDWVPSHQKAIAFGFVSGSLTGGMLVGGLLASRNQSHDLTLYIAFGISVANPIILALVFPSSVSRGATAAAMSHDAPGEIQEELNGPRDVDIQPRAIQRRFTIRLTRADGTDDQEVGRVAKAYRDTMFVIHFLFELPQRWAFIVFILMGLMDTGVHDSFMLFLRSERGFTENDLNHLPVIAGCTGIFTQFLLVPLLQTCGFTLSFMMILGSLSGIGSCLVFAFVTDKGLILAFAQPLCSAGYVAVVASLATISKVGGPAAQNQGLLIGVATGVETLMAAPGPLGLAVILRNYESLPQPFNFAGFGFVICAVILLPAVWCSFRACVANWMERRKRKEEEIANGQSLGSIDQ